MDIVGVCDHASFFTSFSFSAVHSLILLIIFTVNRICRQNVASIFGHDNVQLCPFTVTGLSIDGNLDK